ncbi:hypothetical protein SAY87_022863 [Trapa incisa]|uniref:Uncharacterized protein n=1 Tax=Trapa incisa TaxID=236973 RepID=A0AAN7K514_9MYRT|nr:hypothetical protein SAY87_022863 [Trapa incisa]
MLGEVSFVLLLHLSRCLSPFYFFYSSFFPTFFPNQISRFREAFDIQICLFQLVILYISLLPALSLSLLGGFVPSFSFLCFLERVMEMAENPKPVFGLEEKIAQMGVQKISVSDHIDGLEYSSGRPDDDFVMDMDSFTSKDVPANPRITRSLSRKWPHRGGEEKIIPNSTVNSVEKNERDTSLPSPSPRDSGGSERLIAGSVDHGNNSTQNHHQITITAANIGTAGESRYGRRNSFRRAPSVSPWWILDPKRILLIFATLSSIGTIMLIYFTLSMGKPNNAEGNVPNLKQ